jgi:hypothetical protein
VTPSRLDERIGFRDVSGHGLFDQKIEAHFKKPATYAGMINGGNGEAYSVSLPAQRLKAWEGAGAKLGGHVGGTLGVDIVDADEIRTFHLAIYARVVAAKLAGADHSDTYLFGIGYHVHF